MEQIEPFAEGFVLALAPEFVLIIGLFTLMIVPTWATPSSAFR